MSAAESRALGPSEVRRLFEVWFQGVQREDFRVGLLLSLWRNWMRNAKNPGRTWHPEDWFDSLAPDRPRKQTPEQMFMALSGLVGGGVQVPKRLPGFEEPTE